MSWGVTMEAVNAMNNMSRNLEELAVKIHNEIGLLRQEFDSDKDGLGAHSADIATLLDDVEETEQEGSVPVKKLVLKLTRAAAIRVAHINTKRYSGRSR